MGEACAWVGRFHDIYCMGTPSNLSHCPIHSDAFQLFALSGEILAALEVKNGMGRHIVYILPTLSEFTKVVTLAEIGVAIGVGFVKTSVCIFVLRLLERTHRRVVIILYAVMVLNIAITLVAVFCIAFHCRPFRKIWHPSIPGKCFPTQILTDITRLVGGEFVGLSSCNGRLD